jgi:hypothetical protein
VIDVKQLRAGGLYWFISGRGHFHMVPMLEANTTVVEVEHIFKLPHQDQ